MKRNNEQVRDNELYDMSEAFKLATSINPVRYDVKTNVDNLK
jgi:hypothetical protein